MHLRWGEGVPIDGWDAVTQLFSRLAAEHRFDGYDEMTMKNPIKILTLTLPSILGIVSTVVTVLKTLGDWWIPAGALVVLIACLLALLTKVTAKTALSPATVVPLLQFRSWIRKAMYVVLGMASLVLVFSPIYLTPPPTIERLVPIDPVAGARLQMFGRNLPDESVLTMQLGKEAVSEIFAATRNYLEVRVPPTATSGPILLTKKRTWPLPSQTTVFPVISVQNPAMTVILLTEDIRKGATDVVLLFSVLNTTQRKVTVNELRLETVRVINLGGPRFQEERADLGVASLFDVFEHKATLDLGMPKSLRLLDARYTLKLDRTTSTSFQFRLTSPQVQHHMKLEFVIVMEYFDDTGLCGRRFGNRLFEFETSETSGILPMEGHLLDSSLYESSDWPCGRAH
jgi:hypothetical protein